MIAEDLTPYYNEARKLECEADGLYFFRYFFKDRLGSKALINWHHQLMTDVLQSVIDGLIPRLIITLPPGYTKTEIAVISFMARGLAINARAKFMHLSYSHKLALLNSNTTRSIVKGAAFQDMWPMTLRQDTDSKELWWTEKGGGVYATSMKGQVTGFRAGLMEDGFTGALVIDDALKPDDVFNVEKENVNKRYENTIQSRLAHQMVPVILIMQRVAYDDLAGHLLRGGSGEMWHHLELPVEFPADKYPKENTHAIPVEFDPPTSDVLWDAKHNKAQIVILKTRPRLYNSQYKQRPPKAGQFGLLWDDDSIAKAKALVMKGIKARTVVAVDPSTTSKETSDECGIVVASRYDCSTVVNQKDQYTVESDYSGIMTPFEWATKAMWAYEVHDADAIVVETNNGGDIIETLLRTMGFTGAIVSVHAKKGKYLRAEPQAALYNQGLVRHEEGLVDMEAEMLDFTIQMADSPNRVDAVVYALGSLANLTHNLLW